jgi:hypothetical protein
MGSAEASEGDGQRVAQIAVERKGRSALPVPQSIDGLGDWVGQGSRGARQPLYNPLQVLVGEP